MQAIILQIVGLLIIITLLFLFFTKSNVDNVETKTYSKLIVLNFSFIVVGVATYIVAKFIGNDIYIEILQKIYMSILALLNMYSMFYCISIYDKERKFNFLKKILLGLTIIAILLILILPLTVINEGELLDGIGLSYDVAIVHTVLSFIFFILITINMFLKKQAIKKVFPYIILIVLYLVGFVIREFYKELIFEGFFYSYILFIMYNTIENPDLKMLKEIQKSREFAEHANEEKAMFLYNTSQELKIPINAMEQKCNEMLEMQDIEGIKEEIKKIRFASKKIASTVNEILDMTESKNNNIEISMSRYNIKLLLKEIVSITKINIKDKLLDFRVDFDDTIPEYLLGDAIRLKQIIMTIINNAIKHTEKGFIEFSVSTVIKRDVCRLIIKVEDSGVGIDSKKLETLFYNIDESKKLNQDLYNKIDNTKESLSVAKILTSLIGGTVVVNSELGKGSKFTVVIDQQIVEEKKTMTDIAIEKLSSSKNVLVVDDEEESLKQIAKVLNKYNINVSTVMWGQECLEKIRNHEKYDLILLDEDMPRLNGIKTFEKLKLEDNFNIPVIIMIDEKHIEYKERYLYNGFSGCITKPLRKKDTDKLLSKFLELDD